MDITNVTLHVNKFYSFFYYAHTNISGFKISNSG